MKVELINLGRGNINKTIEVKNAKELHKEIGKHLASKGWGMEEAEEKNIWEITAGFRKVGKIKIIQA